MLEVPEVLEGGEFHSDSGLRLPGRLPISWSETGQWGVPGRMWRTISVAAISQPGMGPFP